MTTEEWTDVPGFDGYEVSNLGRVRSWRQGGFAAGRARDKPLVLSAGNSRGYRLVRLCDGAGITTRLVHSLVLEAFVGPRPDGHQACHNNGQRDDNRIENLRWGTVVENCADKNKHGTQVRGETSGGSLLTTESVLAIRARRAAGEKCSVLARDYGVHESTIGAVLARRNWRHV